MSVKIAHFSDVVATGYLQHRGNSRWRGNAVQVGGRVWNLIAKLRDAKMDGARVDHPPKFFGCYLECGPGEVEEGDDKSDYHLYASLSLLTKPPLAERGADSDGRTAREEDEGDRLLPFC
jgi:hypothetical protein